MIRVIDISSRTPEEIRRGFTIAQCYGVQLHIESRMGCVFAVGGG